MTRLSVETTFRSPECSGVFVRSVGGAEAYAEHPHRFKSDSPHYMPDDKPLIIILPQKLGRLAVELLAKKRAAEVCIAQKTTIYSEPHFMGRWLRITHQ